MQSRMAYILTIIILTGDFVKLRAAVTDPLPAGSDNPAVPVCHSCCQGPAAVPGIPGIPGQPGIGIPGPKGDNCGIGEAGETGFPGPKGDDGIGLPGKIGPQGAVGLPGQHGELGENGTIGHPGTPGNIGPKGDDGIGLPGKMGPRGPPGIVGQTGNNGVKGQKGEQGEAPGNHRVAFTVRRSTSSQTSSSRTTRLPFEYILTRVPGTSFDLETGAFTCNVPGTYVFMFSVNRHPNNHLNVYLRMNNDVVVVAGYCSSRSAGHDQVSGSAVVVLQRGDEVYLTMDGRASSDLNYYRTSFSGFLLYDE